MSKHLNSVQSLLLAAFLALALLGAQALRDSPWHDHGQHVADCASCHLQTTGLEPPAQPLPHPLFALAVLAPLLLRRRLPSLFPAPYQGRAPPSVRLDID